MKNLIEQLLQLQNGNNIRGVAMEGVSREKVNLTPAIANQIAQAFAVYLSEQTGKEGKDLKIGVGHDSRLSAPALMEAVLSGLQALGCQVFNCGLASTPAMFTSTYLPQTNYDGAIMITASHLPFNRNGMKFFNKSGALEKEGVTELLREAYFLTPKEDFDPAHCYTSELMAYYAEQLCEKIRQGVNSIDYRSPLKGLKIILNASNGSGGFFAESVLKKLGANTSGSINLEPDGMFPNHPPNPEDPKAMAALREAVIKAEADLGIIFDTDVDRASVVFDNGMEVNRNKIVALMASIVAKTHPNTTIVTDSVTSDALTDFLENKLHMRHHRFQRGYKNVINEAVRLNETGTPCYLAIETSGHCAFRENHFLDDGAYMSVKILIETAICKLSHKPLSNLIKGLTEATDQRELRLRITHENTRELGQRIIAEFKSHCESLGFTAAQENYEGIRLSFNLAGNQGWMLLRLSLHDPLLVLNMEASQKDGTKMVWDKIKPFFEGFPELLVPRV